SKYIIILQLNDKKQLFIDEITNYLIFCKNSYSFTNGIPKSSAFFFLLGPMLAPATIKLVLEEMELLILPPLSSINIFNSSRLKVSNTPEITIDKPSNLLV